MSGDDPRDPRSTSEAVERAQARVERFALYVNGEREQGEWRMVRAHGRDVVITDGERERTVRTEQLGPLEPGPLLASDQDVAGWYSVITLEGDEADRLIGLIDREGPVAVIEHLSGLDAGGDVMRDSIAYYGVYSSVRPTRDATVHTSGRYTLIVDRDLRGLQLVGEITTDQLSQVRVIPPLSHPAPSLGFGGPASSGVGL